MCKQCGEPHKPPTGKHCRQAREQPGDDNADIRGLIPLVAELKEQMATMNRELKQMKDDKASEEALDSEAKTHTFGKFNISAAMCRTGN